MKAYFQDAKVGDKVWAFGYGQGVITNILTNGEFYPLRVEFAHYTEDFTLGGRSMVKQPLQILFYEEVKYTVPKRKVTKITTTKAVVAYDFSQHEVTLILQDRDAAPNIGASVDVQITYQAEEDEEE